MRRSACKPPAFWKKEAVSVGGSPIHGPNLWAGTAAECHCHTPVSFSRSMFQQVADGGQIPLGYSAVEDGRPINFLQWEE